MGGAARISALREMAIVCGVAAGGLALVSVVALAPWYPAGDGAGLGSAVVQLHAPVAAEVGAAGAR